jgi:hypothetical protein
MALNWEAAAVIPSLVSLAIVVYRVSARVQVALVRQCGSPGEATR